MATQSVPLGEPATFRPSLYDLPLFRGVKFSVAPCSSAGGLLEGAYYMADLIGQLQQAASCGDKTEAEKNAQATEVLAALAKAAINEIGRRYAPDWEIA